MKSLVILRVLPFLTLSTYAQLMQKSTRNLEVIPTAPLQEVVSSRSNFQTIDNSALNEDSRRNPSENGQISSSGTRFDYGNANYPRENIHSSPESETILPIETVPRYRNSQPPLPSPLAPTRTRFDFDNANYLRRNSHSSSDSVTILPLETTPGYRNPQPPSTPPFAPPRTTNQPLPRASRLPPYDRDGYRYGNRITQPPAPPPDDCYPSDQDPNTISHHRNEFTPISALPRNQNHHQQSTYPHNIPAVTTTLHPPLGYNYPSIPTRDVVPQPPAPPPDDDYGVRAHDAAPTHYPALESNHRPTSTDLAKIIQLLENDVEKSTTNLRNSKFYNYHVVKSVPVPVIPVRTFVHPVNVQPANDFFPEEPRASTDPNLKVEVADISCYETQTKSQFRAVLIPSRPRDIAPVFEHRLSTRCEVSQTGLDGRKFFIDLNNNFDDCGVQQCPDNGETRLCVSVRFPTVRGLKLPEDVLINIQCRTQDRTFEQSKTIRVNTLGRPEFRIAPRIAIGGLRYEFQSQMALYRRPSGGSGFTQRMSPGSAVQLGEELQLRCDIRSGDGWQFSRLGDVTVHRGTQDGLPPQDSVILVNPDGCRNPLMKSICPNHPRHDSLNPLSTSVNWRVFMFQDMREGEEMIVSTRLIGCLEQGDCHPECYGHDPHHQRIRRDLSPLNQTADWRSDLTFRVVLPKVTSTHKDKFGNRFEWILLVLSIFISLSLCAIFMISYFIYKTCVGESNSKSEKAEYFNIKLPTRFEID